MKKLLIVLCFLLVGCATVQFVEVKPLVINDNLLTDSMYDIKIQVEQRLKFREQFQHSEYQNFSEGGTATQSGGTWTADIFLFGTAAKGLLIMKRKAERNSSYWLGLKTRQVKNLIKQTSSDGFENFLNFNWLPISNKTFAAISSRMDFKTSDEGLVYIRNTVSADRLIEYYIVYMETIDKSLCPIDPKLMTSAQIYTVKDFEQRAVNAVKIIQN